MMYDTAQQNKLLTIARDAIAHGLKTGTPLSIEIETLPDWLREQRATFVTLEQNGQLRGCIGTLEAQRPLAEDVAHNAYAAAFQDPRFPPVNNAEWPNLDLHISMLSSPEPMTLTSEQDLLKQLRPGVDGLILEDGPARGTFLPAVWDSLPDPRAFIRHLKLKAGLPAEYWSDTLHVWRYTAEYISEN